jgi:hypothetical protein
MSQSYDPANDLPTSPIPIIPTTAEREGRSTDQSVLTDQRNIQLSLTKHSVAYEEDTVTCQANNYREGQLVDS